MSIRSPFPCGESSSRRIARSVLPGKPQSDRSLNVLTISLGDPMTTWRRVSGDTNDTIDVQVLGIDDATAASAWEAHVWATGSAATTCTATATSASVVRVNLGSWLTSATEGAYNLELQATVGGNPKTWPEGTPDQIIVREQGA